MKLRHKKSSPIRRASKPSDSVASAGGLIAAGLGGILLLLAKLVALGLDRCPLRRIDHRCLNNRADRLRLGRRQLDQIVMLEQVTNDRRGRCVASDGRRKHQLRDRQTIALDQAGDHFAKLI